MSLPGNEPSGRAGEGASVVGAPFPIDVFIRTTRNKNQLRQNFLHAVYTRWLMEPVKLHTITDAGIQEGRQWAEWQAKSDPYIFTDDDCLIVGQDWVNRAVKIMLDNPKYAIVSTLSLIEGENLAVPNVPLLVEGTEWPTNPIYPMHAVGQPMLIRKGICVNLLEMNLNNECGVLHKLVLDKGYEEGLFHPSLKIRCNHLGHGFSGSPEHFWGF